MIFIFSLSLLLLVTIGGILHPSTQALCHTVLTGFCLLSGWSNALNGRVVFLCIGLLLIVAVLSRIILDRQSFNPSLRVLFPGLFILLLAISLVTYVLPPSMFRLEYGIVFSIILLGIFYSIASKKIGEQIVGTLCALNALTLVVGLNSQIFAFMTLFTFYVFFLLVAVLITRRTGYVSL